MSSYRFCRTDDISLLADALNRCWRPHFPDEPPMTPADFKQWIRDLQVWCSSCLVAFSGSEPIGVLIGAKRSNATLVHRIAVHPDHRRQGHGAHLLGSLSSKLAILGPPRIVAEVPEALEAAGALFTAAGYVEEAVLTDYLLQDPGRPEHAHREPVGQYPAAVAIADRFVIPLSVDDLLANGLLGDDYPPTCWGRAVETLVAAKATIEGLAVASDERIEAFLLYRAERAAAPRAPSSSAVPSVRILSLRCLVEDDGARAKLLLSRLPLRGGEPVYFPKVHPAELPPQFMQALGFRAAARYRLFAAL